ncbi:MAG TPA: hypothetical protein VFF00_10805 [Candidatus Elarobacter sp.]|nr:hypothetical protein [Dongiaceae bacterium]HZW54519.1 hypothetical protein [Candidatus Elarobacter sp.]
MLVLVEHEALVVREVGVQLRGQRERLRAFAGQVDGERAPRIEVHRGLAVERDRDVGLVAPVRRPRAEIGNLVVVGEPPQRAAVERQQ